MSSFIELEIPNDLAALGTVTQKVNDLLTRCGADSTALFAANLALEELITNIIKYGYDDQEPHRISIRAEIDSDRFHLQISDDGHPFNPFDRPPPDTSIPAEEREIGGLGIHFVRNMLDECHYERRAGRNIVGVAKQLRSD